MECARLIGAAAWVVTGEGGRGLAGDGWTAGVGEEGGAAPRGRWPRPPGYLEKAKGKGRGQSSGVCWCWTIFQPDSRRTQAEEQAAR
ncbi:hypothetical protein GCM10011341_17080 [Frigidibacter albus]|nr:hypothetical protein GCM10011341_17080 [Frigidibacter albus]